MPLTEGYLRRIVLTLSSTGGDDLLVDAFERKAHTWMPPGPIRTIQCYQSMFREADKVAFRKRPTNVW